MPDGGEPVTIKVAPGMAEIDAAEWDACAGDDNPFVSHAFLSVLEDSGAVTGETGWLPQHLVIEDEAGGLIGAVPGYLKSHSYGEYVFDWGWADAFERAGGKYYPKLQVSVPFSPVTGPRLLARPGHDRERTRTLLLAGLTELARQHEVSSFHVTFCTEPEWQMMGEAGLLRRVGQQFHWHNRGYETFDEFLGALSSRKRKMIRKEREAANANVTIETLTGDALGDAHMEAFYGFYLSTVDRKWANAYLNREFFHLLRTRLADRIALVMAFLDGEPVAGALNLIGADTLYGRNWGASHRFKGLYFEACFYRAIAFAIENGLAKVEAGAQGPHKISRGYEPSPTYSAHWIRDKGFSEAVESFLDRERPMMQDEMHALSHHTPYRKDGGTLADG
jgi:predicted N-acyltransferase